jgi:hypothetical protein
LWASKNEGRLLKAALLLDAFLEVSVTACRDLASRGNPPLYQMASLPFLPFSHGVEAVENQIEGCGVLPKSDGFYSQKALCDTPIYSIDGIVGEVKAAIHPFFTSEWLTQITRHRLESLDEAAAVRKLTPGKHDKQTA